MRVLAKLKQIGVPNTISQIVAFVQHDVFLAHCNCMKDCVDGLKCGVVAL